MKLRKSKAAEAVAGPGVVYDHLLIHSDDDSSIVVDIDDGVALHIVGADQDVIAAVALAQVVELEVKRSV